MKTSDKQFRKRRVKQITDLLEKNNLEFNTHIAQTGTRYFTFSDVKIRVSDHSDAYATSDFNCDPYEDEYKSLKKYIKGEGSKMELNLENAQQLADKFHNKGKTQLAHAVYSLLDGRDKAVNHIKTIWDGYEDKIQEEIKMLDENMNKVKVYFK